MVTPATTSGSLWKKARDIETRLIIVETIKVMGKNLEPYRKAFGDKVHEYQWKHIGKSPWIKPDVEYYVNYLSILQNIVTKVGLEFATCREALYSLHTAVNCCGLHYLKPFIEHRPLLRLTLRE